MRRIYFLLLVIFLSLSAVRAQDPDMISGETITREYLQNYLDNPVVRTRFNNDLFDNERAVKLDGKMPYVSGELLNPGQAYVHELAERSVVVKEYFPRRKGRDPEFQGAFRYTGYSLSDIIGDYIISKNNEGEFGLNTDLYVIVQNDKGESAVFSWGELFYTNHNHDIILATHVQPVFPTSSDDEWPLPDDIRLVASNDMISVRNIDKPSKIIIRSFPRSFPGNKGMRPLYSPELEINGPDDKKTVIDNAETESDIFLSHELIFFGTHEGTEGRHRYTGVPLSEILRKYYDFSDQDLAKGLIAIGARDAYRVVFSLSEIMNRTDMAEVMLLDEGDDEDGRFQVHPGADFFADRHIKGANLSYIFIIE